MALLSANIVLCETVLWEKPQIGGNTPSLIRVMSAVALPLGHNFAHFFSVTFLTCQPGEFSEHKLRIQITDKKANGIAYAPEWKFKYGYLLDPFGPGEFILTTEFNIDVQPYQLPLGCLVSAFLDDQIVARTPIMLRRKER